MKNNSNKQLITNKLFRNNTVLSIAVSYTIAFFGLIVALIVNFANSSILSNVLLYIPKSIIGILCMFALWNLYTQKQISPNKLTFTKYNIKIEYIYSLLQLICALIMAVALIISCIIPGKTADFLGKNMGESGDMLVELFNEVASGGSIRVWWIFGCIVISAAIIVVSVIILLCFYTADDAWISYLSKWNGYKLGPKDRVSPASSEENAKKANKLIKNLHLLATVIYIFITLMEFTSDEIGPSLYFFGMAMVSWSSRKIQYK